MLSNVPICLSRVRGGWYSLLLYNADQSDGSMNSLIEVFLSPVIITKIILLGLWEALRNAHIWRQKLL